MANPEDLKNDIRDDIEDPGMVDRLAERIGASATAAAVFGEPVERDGVTVIPVARARWGFGGGSGGEGVNQGSGGGGGTLISPLGFIEMRDGSAEFRAIRDPRIMVVAAAVAAGLAAYVAMR